MRRIKKTVAIIMALVILLPATTASASTNISVTIDGNPIIFNGQQPVSINGRTLVPVRAIFEHLGFDVGWDYATQLVTLTNDLNSIAITIGSAQFTTNGTTYQLDVPAQIINGSTMVPLRASLESIGYTLGWDASTQTVQIASNDRWNFVDDSWQDEEPISEEPQPETTTQEQSISEESQPEPITQEPPNSNESGILGRDLSIYEIIELGGYTNQTTFRNLIDNGHDFYKALDIMERLVFIEANRVRGEAGLDPLVWNYELAAAARSHSRDRLENSFVVHTGSDGSSPSDRAIRHGFNVLNHHGNVAVSEITGGLSSGFPAQSAISRWYNSPPHRAHLMSNTQRALYAGVGLWYNPDLLGGGVRTMKFSLGSH